MIRKLRLTLLFIAFSMVFLTLVDQGATAGISKEQQVRKMIVTGEIAKADHGYIIRGKTPSMIFTVLNPGPELDGYVKSGKTVKIDVRIVSGDNVNIEMIDGKEYPQVGKDSQVRKMSVTGEIGKAAHGYVIRGKTPSMIFTVLNSSPELDGFVESGKTVKVEVRIVSGDNVNIEMIDGKEYPKDSQVRKMSVTGEIAKADHGYIIRGKTPSMIFTVLNSSSELDGFVKSGKTVKVEVRIVSGDNVNIEMIDGKPYP